MNLFERLKRQQRHEPPKTIPPANLRTYLAGRFLNWLLNNWKKSTISAFEIYTYGPVPIRNPKEAINAAEILTQRGWLTPLRAHRHDRKLWLINRENKPTEISHTKKTAANPSDSIISHY
jgi:hypothetical protein